MEEQKRENKEELQQETAEEKNSGQGNSSTRSSLLWIFAGGYLVYTGYRLCASVISGAEDSGVVFLAAGGTPQLTFFSLPRFPDFEKLPLPLFSQQLLPAHVSVRQPLQDYGSP